MSLSGILDIVNSIVFFQLIFFSLFLFIKGRKIPSVNFLKIHLFCQLMVFVSYPFWKHEYSFFRYLFLLSQPALFLLGPTFYFYVRSRLYRNFDLSWNLLIHAIPAGAAIVLVTAVLIRNTDFHENIKKLNHNLYYLVKVQMFLYISITIQQIYIYQKGLKQVTSASEKDKLAWLFLISYGLLFTSMFDFLIFSIPAFTDRGIGFLLFFVFINIFFFKAIVQPDQFLGLNEGDSAGSGLTGEKSIRYFEKIEGIINSKQLFLDPELSLHEVSMAVGLSERVISQCIKQNTYMNFCDYINLKRIDYAKEILIATTKAERNVLEILYESGFNSKSVFNTQFKKHTGVSPTEFRENNFRRST